MSPRRPALRYHGGKWRLAPWIIEHLPPHRIYVEPFGGGASVLLRKARSYAEVYNDLDDELVNYFRVLRDPRRAARLAALLRDTPFARSEFEAAYAPTRESVERARRTAIRSFMGFGSASILPRHRTGFRANSNRSGTTPAHDWANYADLLPSLSERLRGVVIERRPALDCIDQHDTEETLHYVDPPYPHDTRTRRGHTNNKVYRFELSDDEHRQLAATLRSARGMVVLSGYASDLYDRELYPDWHRVSCHARADGALARIEVLWFNRAAERALAQQPLFARGAA